MTVKNSSKFKTSQDSVEYEQEDGFLGSTNIVLWERYPSLMLFMLWKETMDLYIRGSRGCR